MLRAWIHRKLGRPRMDEGAEAAGSASGELTAREDPLTSAVFERFAYLEPGATWTLLTTAASGGGAWRATPMVALAKARWTPKVSGIRIVVVLLKSQIWSMRLP
ncbi:hypothetical protein [Sorangium sp. So ce131]|uniref:hypothetical protein n=1 Tax=Sorangium sp. So ce131 TaxID=3133282 RepID=UPI003F616CC2